MVRLDLHPSVSVGSLTVVVGTGIRISEEEGHVARNKWRKRQSLEFVDGFQQTDSEDDAWQRQLRSLSTLFRDSRIHSEKVVNISRIFSL